MTGRAADVTTVSLAGSASGEEGFFVEGEESVMPTLGEDTPLDGVSRPANFESSRRTLTAANSEDSNCCKSGPLSRPAPNGPPPLKKLEFKASYNGVWTKISEVD